MDIVVAIPLLETVHGSIGPTRPSAPTDGVDVTAWHNLPGTQALAAIAAYVKSDGSLRSLTSPTDGSNGVELHAYIPDKDGAFAWWLVGYLDGGNPAVVVPAAGGSVRELRLVSYASRLAICGTPSAGSLTYYFVPLATGTSP